jgi:hypothetical protein
MKICIDSINIHKDRADMFSKRICEHSQNILLRYLISLDSMTSYQKPKDPKFDEIS